MRSNPPPTDHCGFDFDQQGEEYTKNVKEESKNDKEESNNDEDEESYKVQVQRRIACNKNKLQALGLLSLPDNKALSSSAAMLSKKKKSDHGLTEPSHSSE